MLLWSTHSCCKSSVQCLTPHNVSIKGSAKGSPERGRLCTVLLSETHLPNRITNNRWPQSPHSHMDSVFMGSCHLSVSQSTNRDFPRLQPTNPLSTSTPNDFHKLFMKVRNRKTHQSSKFTDHVCLTLQCWWICLSPHPCSWMIELRLQRHC